MKKLLLSSLVMLFALASKAQQSDNTQYVDPFIGTQMDETGALSGSTFPGACVPFGMVQLSPETEKYVTYDPCSGYDYDKDKIYGITHTHLSGTGCTDLIDVSLLPATCDLTPSYIAAGDFSQTFSHDEEGATPGYYWVKLQESGVKVELTATEHCGIHRYTYPEGAKRQVILDLDHMTYRGNDTYYSSRRGYSIINSQIRFVDDHTIEGYRIVTGWAKLRRVYFHAEFSKPIVHHYVMKGDENLFETSVANGRNLRAALVFDDGEDLLIKVSISAVDSEGARRNFNAECTSWDFAKYVADAHDLWRKELSKIEISGTDTEKRIFYTGMYHAYIQPNVMSDVDGRYMTTNYEIKQMPEGKKYYSTFSLWDTFRAAHPLYNLLEPELTADFINSMLLHHQEYGYLPIWDLWGQDNYCMIGNHAIPVISRAILSDIQGFDKEEAYKAMYESSIRPHYNSPFVLWEKYGYYPATLQDESVSITLEQAFDDWCVYACAEKFGKTNDAKHFLERSEFYRNIFDESIGTFAPKDEAGNWVRPYDVLSYENGHFAEGNAWQYMWFVPQNPQGLIELLGGKEKFIEKLNENFSLEAKSGETNGNASGFIGQYAHGNEPSHHTVYMYNFAGQPKRTQELVNEVRNRFYSDRPCGYAGNDDCGQMSAWYIFSSMGFYPFNAGSDDFSIGTPLFNETVINLPNGKTFIVKSNRKSDKDIYVKSVKLNGVAITDWRITQQQIMEGGVLEFKMGRK